VVVNSVASDTLVEETEGVGRDGPLAQNSFLRRIDSTFSVFTDVDGYVTDLFDHRIERDGMAHVTTPQRSVFVLEAERGILAPLGFPEHGLAAAG
jgi:peroxiredoxin